MDDISFHVYVFDRHWRKDYIDEQFILIFPTNYKNNNNNNTHTGLWATRMTYLASYIYCYSIDTGVYKIIKNRSGIAPEKPISKLSSITTASTVHIMNLDIGSYDKNINDYLNHSKIHNHHTMTLVEVSLDG